MSVRTSKTPPGTKMHDYIVIAEIGGGMLQVQCACGSEPREVKRNNFLSGRTKGCMECRYTRRARPVDVPRWGVQQIYGSYVASAQKRGIEFCFDLDQFREIILKDCYYCDSAPSNVKKIGSKNEPFMYNGIDRVDSDGPYSIDNTVPACRFCNYAKRERTTQEFMEWIARLCNKYDNLD